MKTRRPNCSTDGMKTTSVSSDDSFLSDMDSITCTGMPSSNGRIPASDPMAIRFESEDGSLTVVDTIERRQYSLSLSDANAPTETSTERFRAPVDAAVTVETDAIDLPTVIAVYVRDGDGTMLAETGRFTDETFPDGTYSLELCAPMKLYVRVEGPMRLAVDADRIRIEFPERTTVALGARSKHDRPAASITTTDDPRDVLAAISAFGSALKTTSPERSYPTLRGHPPTIERGEHLDIPGTLASPETGVRIELPVEYRYAYAAAPLAYYLGATLKPGDRARIVTDSGFVHPLGEGNAFEQAVERVLKQTFFLDCVTRTEGLYPIDLHERRAIEDAVDLDFAALYDQSLSTRLKAYLRIPYETVEPHVPEWKLTSHVVPTADSVEMLPFLVNDLAVIRTPDSQRVPAGRTETAAVEGFLRSPDRTTTVSASTSSSEYIEPETTDSLEQAWVGNETPMGASKATPQAYRNRLDREQSTGDIDILVVCNDPAMDEERELVDAAYGSRDTLPFDIRIERDLTTDELATVLETDTDFLHYIGHIEPEGFECSDGRLDATTVDRVGVDAFLLNGCQSYEQGMALIDGGAIGGIVTLTDVVNTGAVSVGSTLARLLNQGFPLRAALEVAKNEDVIGEQYIVVGDGGLTIVQGKSGTPTVCSISTTENGFEIEIRAYITMIEGMGSIILPRVKNNCKYYLNSGLITTFHVTKDELLRFLDLENLPVKFNGNLSWSSNISDEDL